MIQGMVRDSWNGVIPGMVCFLEWGGMVQGN